MTKKEGAQPAPIVSARKALSGTTEKRWKDRVAEIEQLRKSISGNILQYRYEVGLFASEIISDKAQETNNKMYGTHTVDDICAVLNESATSVRACVRFAQRVDQRELERMKNKEYPWRVVMSLLTLNDQKTYTELKTRWEKGEFETSDDLKALVTSINGGDGPKPPDDKGGKKDTTKSNSSSTAATMVKSLNTLLSQATSKVIPGFMKATTDFAKKGDKLAPATVKAVTEGIKDAKKRIRSACVLLEKAERVIEESGM